MNFKFSSFVKTPKRTFATGCVITLMTAIALMFIISYSVGANAAIPHSKTIVARLAKNSGRGVYVVEQELRFAGPEGIVLKERWLVQNSDVMRLIVQSPKQDLKQAADFRWDAVYREGRRTASSPAAPAIASAEPGRLSEPGKDAKTTAVSAEFFEPYLFHRSSAKFFEAFIKNKILPAAAGRERPRIANINTYKSMPEQAVRLGRSGGVVAWVFGEPTPIDNATAFPGAWVEQDTFLLKKLRLLSQAEMVLGNHANSGGGLKLARERSIIWKSSDSAITEPRSVTIRVTSVKNLPEKSLAPQFLISSISPSEIKSARLPEAAIVREFYTRFR